MGMTTWPKITRLAHLQSSKIQCQIEASETENKIYKRKPNKRKLKTRKPKTRKSKKSKSLSN